MLAFSGHRPHKLGYNGYSFDAPLRIAIRLAMRAKLLEIQPEKCISGMALGIDQDAAVVCNDLRIPWIAAIPCEGQDRLWPESSRETYRRLLATATEVRVISPGPYSAQKMIIRDHWMVDNSKKVLAVWDGSKGGTGQTVTYAIEKMLEGKVKKLIRIHPKEVIFVFGSNRAGRHGKGAALHAAQFWGAEAWVGEGLTGQSYALPTKDTDIRTLPLSDIAYHVDNFISFAHAHQKHFFQVTRVGCGYAGYTDKDIGPMFAAAPRNCLLPSEWEVYRGL